MLQLVEKIKAHGILMDRGTRSFTLDQFSRIRRFSRDKRCIKPCTYTGRASGVLHTGREVSKNATNFRDPGDEFLYVIAARYAILSSRLLNLFLSRYYNTRCNLSPFVYSLPHRHQSEYTVTKEKSYREKNIASIYNEHVARCIRPFIVSSVAKSIAGRKARTFRRILQS